MRLATAYFGGLLVGTAIAFEAPRGWVHNWWVFAVGALLLFTAGLWPKGKPKVEVHFIHSWPGQAYACGGSWPGMSLYWGNWLKMLTVSWAWFGTRHWIQVVL